MREIYRQVTNWQCHCIFTSPRGWKSTSLFFLGAVFWCNRRPGCGIFRWKKQSFWDFCIMFIHLFAIFCYGFLRELWGPAWAVCSYSRSPPAGGIPQVLNLTNDWMNNTVLSSTTLRLLWWTTGHCNSSRLGQSFSLSRQAVTALVARSGSANQRTDERQADILFLKHANSILRQSSTPICGFSMMDQGGLCAVWPTYRQIFGWLLLW